MRKFMQGIRRSTISFGLLLSTAFLGAATGDEHWDRHFGWPGTSNVVQALTLDGDRIYAAGYYANPSINTNMFIEVWDGTRWGRIEGLSGSTPVVDIAIMGNDLYAAGVISRADGELVAGLARWNGSGWSDVGGFSGVAFALATDGVNLYVGGIFTNLGGLTTTNIAMWNGSQWSTLGGGLGPYSASAAWYVYTIEIHDGQVYAGGSFTNAGGSLVRHLARWDGNSWTEVGGGVGGPVSALASHGSDLYVGGMFTNSGSVGIVRWTGAAWAPMGVGVRAAPSFALIKGSVSGIGFLGSDVYVGGSFTNAGGSPARFIAKWNGSSWSTNGVVLNGSATRIRTQGTNLFIGGSFVQANSTLVNHVARYDGTAFYGMGPADRIHGLGPTVLSARAVTVSGTNVYVGGIFTSAGDIAANRIARWDGNRWWPLGGGVTGTNTSSGTAVNAIAVDGQTVYAGGSFTNAGGVTARNVARWDGTNWWPLGGGIPGGVNTMAMQGSDVLVGGNFQLSATEGTAFNIARWDGAAWHVIPGSFIGTIGNFFVNAIAVSGSDVYVGGSFSAGGTSKNIARHNGSDWVPIGTGANSNVNAIVVAGDDVYIGGRFTNVNGVAASRVAKWSGGQWSALGTGVVGPGTFSVSGLAAIGTNLYAAGNFTNVGGILTTGIVVWDGTAWAALGQGVGRSIGSTTVAELAAAGNDLYAVGNFEYAGGEPSYYIARWNDQVDFIPWLQLGDPALQDGNFQFRLTANAVSDYVIDRTTDFDTWVPIHSNTISPLDFTDSNAPPAGAFYRGRH